MPAVNQDFQIGTDRTKILTIPILDQSGQPYNMAGGQVNWAMALNPSFPPVLTKLFGAGVTLSEIDTVWHAIVVLSPADTKGLAPGDYSHELSGADYEGNAVNITVGKVTVRQSIYQGF